MKSLKSNSTPSLITNEDIIEIQNKFSIQIPEYFISFIKNHGGTSTKEVVFNDKFWVNFFLPLKSDINTSITTLKEGQIFNYNDNAWLPFAIDSGGWAFCIALKDEIKGQVWVDKFDSGDESPFEFVSSSFEEFINGLKQKKKHFHKNHLQYSKRLRGYLSNAFFNNVL